MVLTKEQRQAVEGGARVAITIDGIECVVVRADLSDGLLPSAGDDWATEELRAIAARTFEDADDAPRIEP